MNSNPNDSKLNNHLRTPAYISLGISFGVRDSNGEILKTIKSSFLLSKILTEADLLAGSVISPNKHSIPYLLSVDSALRTKIFKEGKAACIISFQQREEGNFAVARLWEEKRTRPKATFRVTESL